jgi:RimJ/RimL family protein N-acetyltransferase
VLPLHADPVASISGIVRELRDTPGRLAQMSRHAAEICDGDGAFRVGSAIDELLFPEPAKKLTLRKGTAEDDRRLWLWRNEHRARTMFGDQQTVPWERHVAWLTARLADANTRLFIVEADGRPCGNVRFDAELTGTATVSIAMTRHARGFGYGAAALTLACQEVFNQRFCDRIEAKVKRENFASQRIFAKSGFLPAGEDAQYCVYQRLRRADHEPDSELAGRAG